VLAQLAAAAVDLDPLSLLARLAASVPPPRFHTVRYSGIVGSAARWRARVVPPPPEEAPAPAPEAAAAPPSHACSSPKPRPSTHRSVRRRWAELLRSTFGPHAPACPSCGGRLELRALVTAPRSIRRFLAHLGEPVEPPPISPARDPPTYQSRILRRRALDLDPAPAFVEH